tara:strand:+ start:1557 stop:2489 length:933 start_codon:yes stop_codon:yes gene_type:complete
MIPHPHELGLKPGLKQVQGRGDTLKSTHDSKTGWKLNYYMTPVKIYVQDELTFLDGKVLEIENYIQYYGESIKDVTFYTDVQGLEKTYKNLKFVYYPDFSCLHMQDLKRHNVKFNFEGNKQFVFLCLNFNIRSHRDLTVKLLQNFPSRLISYKARNWHLPEFSDLSMDEYRDYELYNKNILKNTANLIKLKPIFQRCQFSVVTETRYDLPYTFITEKTTQCFVTLHPALYVSNKYHVASMRDYGFDMFDDIFDHSYDNLNNDVRLNHMINSNKDVLTNGIKDYNKLENRLKANRNHYFDIENEIYKIEKR